MTLPLFFKKTSLIIMLCIGAVLAAAGIYLVIHFGLFQNIIALINEDLPEPLFLVLMVLLPVAGFPISIFLVIAGIKFGVFWGILLWLLILPLHTTIAFLAVKSLRPFLENLLSNTMGYTVPAIPYEREALFSFIFLAIPGIPYAGKNYLLPLAGASFRSCVLMNCIVQSLLGLPFILLGKSGADLNLSLFSAALVAFLLLFILLHKLKKKFEQS
ncbi:MAG: hypothetical protein V2I36_17025 [Desulfopila sp.]|nr:hypothetical protein [Desulfopila sp.]